MPPVCDKLAMSTGSYRPCGLVAYFRGRVILSLMAKRVCTLVLFISVAVILLNFRRDHYEYIQSLPQKGFSKSKVMS